MIEQASRFGPKTASTPDGQAVGESLLRHLQTALGDATITYAATPSRITGGFDTAIWAFQLAGGEGGWGRPLILRVYRDGGQEQARFETTAQNAVAAQGYPAPRMLLTCEDASVLGNAFTVIQRVPGETMLERVLSPALPRIPVLLAQAHARLHALDVAPVRAALAAAGFDETRRGTTDFDTWREWIDAGRLRGLQEALAWVVASHPPSNRPLAICHGDFHPLNIMMESGAVTGVLDWANLCFEDPMWDVGATAALFGQGPVDLPRPIRPIVNFTRRRLLNRYLRTYAAERTLDMMAVRYFEGLRLLGFMLEVGIYRQALAGAVPASSKPTAFNDPHVLGGITRRFAEISGVEPSLPPDPAIPSGS